MDVVRQSDFEEFQYGKETVQTTTNINFKLLGNPVLRLI